LRHSHHEGAKYTKIFVFRTSATQNTAELLNQLKRLERFEPLERLEQFKWLNGLNVLSFLMSLNFEPGTLNRPMFGLNVLNEFL